MSYFDSALDRILSEALESRMPHLVASLLGKKSRWSGKKSENPEEAARDFVQDIEQYDPSPNGQYMPYLVKQVVFGNIALPEDGYLFKEMLITFMDKGTDWHGETDVFKYKNWRALQKATNEYVKNRPKITSGSTRSALNTLWQAAREGSDIVYEEDIRIAASQKVKCGSHYFHMADPDGGVTTTNYKIVECNTWQAAAMYGRGTEWCTAFSSPSMVQDEVVKRSSTLRSAVEKLLGVFFSSVLDDTPWEGWTRDDFVAEIYTLNGWPHDKPLDEIGERRFKAPNSYLLHSKNNGISYLAGGPIYIVYKENKPYMQFTDDGGEMRNTEDTSLSWPGPPLARVLVSFMRTGKASESFVDNVSFKIREGKENWAKNKISDFLRILSDITPVRVGDDIRYMYFGEEVSCIRDHTAFKHDGYSGDNGFYIVSELGAFFYDPNSYKPSWSYEKTQ